MTKFNKIYVFVIVIVVLIALVIGTIFLSEKEEKKDNTFNIVTTFYPVELIVQNLIKDTVNVESVNISATSGGCVHDYEMTPDDMKTFENADVIVINGQGMEHFMDRINVNTYVLDSSKNIPNKGVSSHIWMDIDNYISQVQVIGDTLCSVNEENKDVYIKNMNEYIQKINGVKEKFNIQTDKKVMIMHDSFKYYENIGMFDILAEFVAGHEGNYSANDLKNVISNMNNMNIQILFVDNETYDKNKTLVDTIVNETNSRVYVLDLIVDVNENLDTYIRSMEQNLEVIKEAVEYGK